MYVRDPCSIPRSHVVASVGDTLHSWNYSRVATSIPATRVMKMLCDSRGRKYVDYVGIPLLLL